MKIFRLLLIMAITILIVCTLTSCKMTNSLVFRGMDNLPQGEFLAAYKSPLENYTVNIYLCGGNATTDFSIRGEVVDNEDESRKNIYWCYHEQDAEVEWISDTIVSINSKQLDLSKNQIYDWRK